VVVVNAAAALGAPAEVRAAAAARRRCPCAITVLPEHEQFDLAVVSANIFAPTASWLGVVTVADAPTWVVVMISLLVAGWWLAAYRNGCCRPRRARNVVAALVAQEA
jgi:hypothetical protein